jgi:hypothetical protein
MTSDMSAAQVKLDAAVEEFLRETEWNEAGVLTGWVLVGAQMGVDSVGDGTSVYPVIYMGGQQAPHVTIGLLSMGLRATENHFHSDD